jgi:hypothetical protein
MGLACGHAQSRHSFLHEVADGRQHDQRRQEMETVLAARLHMGGHRSSIVVCLHHDRAWAEDHEKGEDMLCQERRTRYACYAYPRRVRPELRIEVPPGAQGASSWFHPWRMRLKRIESVSRLSKRRPAASLDHPSAPIGRSKKQDSGSNAVCSSWFLLLQSGRDRSIRTRQGAIRSGSEQGTVGSGG